MSIGATGITSKTRYSEFLQTPFWKALRLRAIKRDEGRCNRCGCNHHLQVHHRVYRTPWESTLIEDLETLCNRCHDREHETKNEDLIIQIHPRRASKIRRTQKAVKVNTFIQPVISINGWVPKFPCKIWGEKLDKKKRLINGYKDTKNRKKLSPK